MIENEEVDNLEVGLSHIVSKVSESFAYVKISVDLLPTLDELASNGIIISQKSLDIASLRRDIDNLKGIEMRVNYYNDMLGSTGSTEEERQADPAIPDRRFYQWEARRKTTFDDLIKFGSYLKENYDQLLVLAQFCGMIKGSDGSIDYSVYGSEVTSAARKKVMAALREQEIRELRFFRGAIEETDHVYKLLGGDMPVQEFRDQIRKLKPELNGQSVVKLDSFKGDYELAAVLNFKTAEEQNACIVQVTDKKEVPCSTRRQRLYAVGGKTLAVRLPNTIFQDAVLTQLAFYENEMERIRYVRNRNGF